ncbi:hypothetical protein [Streptomyces sp. NPDC096012]|uniref:hypothetical protein n=1 Tax=Streptomyces sp. NPDC096012 TaxID=3155684 RepID=UPI00336A1E4F
MNEVAADPASNATCTINKITINRFSECEWVTIHVDVIKVINGRPVIEGTVDFDVKHQMTLKANSANWSEKFHVSKARTTRAGKGVAAKIAAASGGGTHLPAGQREITWVKVNENKSQGGTVTAWRGKMHVMDHAPFYVIV